MYFTLNSKSFFFILILIILSVLIINFLNRNQKQTSQVQNINVIDPSKEDKTIGVNIEQNQSNGEKIKIVADQMIENQSDNSIKLINPTTKIIKNDDVTQISSNYAYIINGFKQFRLNQNVSIQNKKKRFLLKTQELSGKFNSGDMVAPLPVRIKIQNSTIQGTSLSMEKYGEYIKVFGKAKLIIN